LKLKTSTKQHRISWSIDDVPTSRHPCLCFCERWWEGHVVPLLGIRRGWIHPGSLGFGHLTEKGQASHPEIHVWPLMVINGDLMGFSGGWMASNGD
jgi:hypothetical protein